MSTSAGSSDTAAAASYEGWPPRARALVEKAVDAHGGRPRWQSVPSIRLSFGSAVGILPALKGYPRSFGVPRAYEIRPHDRVTIFHGYPDEQHRGRFADGDVSIESLVDGGSPVESRNHRNTFRGLAKYRRWDPLDALYFFGYALWHYHVLPFTLGDARFVRLRRCNGLEGVEVDFPPEIHTHCQRQSFYFGGDGRIVRHDYVADVVGAWARGCHFWEVYERVGGLLVARRRRVVARVFGHPTSLTVLRVEFLQASA
jgi:hypothetical protein